MNKPTPSSNFPNIVDVWTEQPGVGISFERLENGSVAVRLYGEGYFEAHYTIAAWRWNRIVDKLEESAPVPR